MATAPDLKPWGRFKLVSKDPAEESDHVYFYRTETRVGRSPQRAHAVIKLLFISGVHCIVKIVGEKENGDPTVMLQDLSRNGIYINEVRIDQDVGVAEITDNATIHFTKPGLSVKGIPATVYRFELLRDGLTPENVRLRIERDAVKEPRRLVSGRAKPATPASLSSAPATQATPSTPVTPPAGVTATTRSATGKRQRRTEDAHMLEEMEVEVTRTLSASSVAVEPSSSTKRRRTGDPGGADGGASEELTAMSTKRRRTDDRAGAGGEIVDLVTASTKRRRADDSSGAGTDITAGEDLFATSTKRRRTDDRVGAGADAVEDLVAASTKRRRADDSSGVGAAITAGEDLLATSTKRQRTGDHVRADFEADADLIASSAKFRDLNNELRQKLADANDRESDLKNKLSQAERDILTLQDELLASGESRSLAENEAKLKGERLSDREKELEQLQLMADSMETQIEELQVQLVSIRKNEAVQAKLVDQLRAEREGVALEMDRMTAQLNDAQTKSRKAEERVKAMYESQKKLELALDAAQTRSAQFEEGKRGVTEETMFLRMKMSMMYKLFKELNQWSAHGMRTAQDERAMISPELEALKTVDQLISSSELSQPTPTQENFADTQPIDGDEEEQTLDQDAAAARAGLLAAPERPANQNPFESEHSELLAAPDRPANQNPFESEHSKISIHQSLSMELMEEQAQPLSSFSTDPSSGATEGSSGVTEPSTTNAEAGKSSLSESITSTSLLMSKAPPAPVPKRQKVMPPSLENDEETKSDGDGDAEDEKEDDDDEEGEGEGDDVDAQDTALPDDEEVQNNKENTPIEPPVSAAAIAAASTKTTPPLPPAPQQTWLQTIVTNDDDKSEQVSASEGGGIFDDETQLSDGE